ncbi:YciI family protein [Methanococcus maripaludis]|uniref:YciI-like protein n=1 Tax=Methanococcus maripaludis TaxID=39152 RepID=A0A2L1CC60_METMI|nr:YciI family protein [Methanococcus maripaludis]AVB76947.1 YciI-like protein [Methanococcus maripaludis]MBA2863459.1 uncharacterized protein YciI [Methanococcus maripaludis]MBB6496537.1 uncharacterized protein YciI [Methanococcus maripaludis]
MFIISVTYKKPIEVVEKYLAEHIEFLKKNYELQKLLASGRKVPRTGGVIISNVKTKEEVLDMLKDDPFYINEIYDYEIIEFTPSLTSKELEFLKEI